MWSVCFVFSLFMSDILVKFYTHFIHVKEKGFILFVYGFSLHFIVLFSYWILVTQ